MLGRRKSTFLQDAAMRYGLPIIFSFAMVRIPVKQSFRCTFSHGKTWSILKTEGLGGMPEELPSLLSLKLSLRFQICISTAHGLGLLRSSLLLLQEAVKISQNEFSKYPQMT